MSLFREIQFENNPQKVCFSGQLLTGKANVYFPVDTHVKEIYITFVGKGFCKWSKGAEQLTRSETYFNKRLDFLQNTNTEHDSTVIPAGNNYYPFEIQLNPHLPTSYEGTYGFIRYTATLHIDRKVKKINPFDVTFTIVKPLNLNNEISYRTPLEKREFTKFNHCCLCVCWKTAELKIFARLPVRGYCPGQTINLNLDVINNSYREVLHFLVHFIKEVTYTASNGLTKVERVILTQRQTEGCRADRTGIQSMRINIKVPSLPPTCFSANVCGCRYMFRITGRTGFCDHNPVFEIPVVIGTYPISDELYSARVDTIDENESHNFIAPTAPSLEGFNDTAITNDSELPPYPDSDPPTYEEAMKIPTGKEGFVPKYPTYRRQTTYASNDA